MILSERINIMMPNVKKTITTNSIKNNKHMHCCVSEISNVVVETVTNNFFDYVLKVSNDIEFFLVIDILNWLTEKAKEFRQNTQYPQDEVDAILVVIINSIAGNQWGVDYCLYAKDLK